MEFRKRLGLGSASTGESSGKSKSPLVEGDSSEDEPHKEVMFSLDHQKDHVENSKEGPVLYIQQKLKKLHQL